jgi:hypothetical protein
VTDRHDDDLRALFATLRSEDAARATPFAIPRPRKDTAPIPLRWATAAGLAAAALVALAVVHARRAARAERFRAYASVTAWRAPTDFLLDTPGRALLRGVPGVVLPAVRTAPEPSPRPDGDTTRPSQRET